MCMYTHNVYCILDNDITYIMYIYYAYIMYIYLYEYYVRRIIWKIFTRILFSMHNSSCGWCFVENVKIL